MASAGCLKVYEDCDGRKTVIRKMPHLGCGKSSEDCDCRNTVIRKMPHSGCTQGILTDSPELVLPAGR